MCIVTNTIDGGYPWQAMAAFSTDAAQYPILKPVIPFQHQDAEDGNVAVINTRVTDRF
jgi:hypothetical protein